MSVTSTPVRVFLLPGRDRRVGSGHPWAYSNEINMDAATKALTAGEVATLHRVDGKPLGVGTFNPHTLISFRVLAQNPTTPIDRTFFETRLKAALALRERLYDEPYYRLVHGEADGLGGLVVDRYGDIVVIQTATAGMERLLPELLAALDSVINPSAVMLRNDGSFRRLENLETYVRPAKGTVPESVEVHERGLRFPADVTAGQKTGWFLDQRDARNFVAPLAKGGRMLDVYSHIGGFAIAALKAGAERAIAVDSSAKALELAELAGKWNDVSDRLSVVKAEAFGELERLRSAGDRFRVVACDPPAFVRIAKELKTGLKGYRKLVRLAAAVVEPGGFLFIASCSHNVTVEAFASEVAAGVQRAGRDGRILRSTGAGPDHPVHPRLPESAYLKGLVLQLD